MTKATTIGLDIAKQVFQVHGADKAERPVLRRKLRRSEVIRFFSDQSPCLVGIEASGSAHYWARVLSGLGHTVRLMAPQFVKPYVKSQKNDANDAEAICEAVTRPNMRFVPQKIRRAAGPAVPASCPQPAGCESDPAHQPDPRSAGRVWDRIAAASRAGAQRLTGGAGRRGEPADRLWPGAVSEPLRRARAAGPEDRCRRQAVFRSHSRAPRTAGA